MSLWSVGGRVDRVAVGSSILTLFCCYYLHFTFSFTHIILPYFFFLLAYFTFFTFFSYLLISTFLLVYCTFTFLLYLVSYCPRLFAFTRKAPLASYSWSSVLMLTGRWARGRNVSWTIFLLDVSNIHFLHWASFYWKRDEEKGCFGIGNARMIYTYTKSNMHAKKRGRCKRLITRAAAGFSILKVENHWASLFLDNSWKTW